MLIFRCENGLLFSERMNTSLQIIPCLWKLVLWAMLKYVHIDHEFFFLFFYLEEKKLELGFWILEIKCHKTTTCKTLTSSSLKPNMVLVISLVNWKISQFTFQSSPIREYIQVNSHGVPCGLLDFLTFKNTEYSSILN